MVVTTNSLSGESTPRFNRNQVVRVSDAAVASGRSFDFGEIYEVNADGTYAVLWGKAGCACMGIPNENADQLTAATSEEWDAYYEGTFPIPNGPDGKPAEEPLVGLSVDPEDDEEDYDDYDEDEEDEEDDFYASTYDAPVTV